MHQTIHISFRQKTGNKCAKIPNEFLFVIKIVTGFASEKELVAAYQTSAESFETNASNDFDATAPVLAGVVFESNFTNASFPSEIQVIISLFLQQKIPWSISSCWLLFNNFSTNCGSQLDYEVNLMWLKKSLAWKRPGLRRSFIPCFNCLAQELEIKRREVYLDITMKDFYTSNTQLNGLWFDPFWIRLQMNLQTLKSTLWNYNGSHIQLIQMTNTCLHFKHFYHCLCSWVSFTQ